MQSPRYTSPPVEFSRVTSMNSNASSGRRGRTQPSTIDAASEIVSLHSESPRAHYHDQLQELAAAAGIPFSLPKPMLSQPGQRAVPQNPSDKAGAEQYLMSLRPKKFLVGKSSKGFTNDEIMLGLDKAAQGNMPLPLIEALLQLAESYGVNASNTSVAFTANKKGHAIPTIDYVFSQTIRPQSFDLWRLFLGRVSQRARDNALAGALKDRSQSIERVQELLEWGANPQGCRDEILALVSSANSEDLVEALLLSPALGNPEFLSQALIQSTSCHSLRNSSMLLLRGADGNFNHGEALKMAISKQHYDTALAITLLSKRPVSSSILDDATAVVGSLSRDTQKPYLKMLLYAGACGLRTSRAVTPYITKRDDEITSLLVESFAFCHGSFPAAALFQAAVDARDTALALNVLRLSKNRSFSDYASTGVHVQLVQNFNVNPEESLEIVSELLTLGVTGDFTSQMLVKCCEPEQIEIPEILDLLDLLIRAGGAKASYAEGACILLAIDAAFPAVVKTLMSAHPTKKILNSAMAYADSVLRDGDPAKLEIWSTLLQSGAAGQTIDRQLVAAIDKTPQAFDKVKALLPGASLDYCEGEAIIKAIQLDRLDILEMCLGKKAPRSSLSSIWKQTRKMFAIPGDMPYSLVYMQAIFNALYSVDKDLAPLGELLHDATQCHSKETALALSSQFLRWGASPNHSLGAPLTSCVKRSDTKTLAVLLSQKPTKTSLKYAFEEALSARRARRYENIKLIIDAGLEKASLDAALPTILKEDCYESSTAHLLVGSGARLHSSFGEHLITPTVHLDLQLVETLISRSGDRESVLLPLETILSSRSDWQTPEGQSLPMVKMLLANVNRGAWADRLFVIQTKALNQHAADLFIRHLTSEQILSNALRELLSHDKANLSREKLSMATYLLKQGAVGEIIDETFLQVAQALNYEWLTVLYPHLLSPNTKLSAFEIIGSNQQSEAFSMRQFLLNQGIQGRAVDEAFIMSASTADLKELQHLLPSVSSPNKLSEALDALAMKSDFASTNNGRAAIKLLLEKGAAGASVLNAARAAGRVESQTGVELIVGMSKDHAAGNAALRGLMDREEPLKSSESRAILRYLVESCWNDEDAKWVARLAVTNYDVGLMRDITSAGNSGELYDLGLATVATTDEKWLSPTGLHFLEFLLDQGARGPMVLKLIETASRLRHLPALRLLQGACSDREQAANVAFASFISDDKATLSPEGLAVLDLLLEEGAKGVAVENAASHAAKSSNYDALDVFLKSPAAASIIPAAFRAVARDRSKHLSSEQLSIASILVKHGVSTEVLAIATIEAAKLLDLEALKVLSRSPRFSGVTDDTLRALLLSEELWRSSEGLRIMQYLLEIGVSLKSTETATSKASTALDIDALRVLLDSNDSTPIVEVAFISMTALEKGWLCPEGLRIADLLVQKGPSQTSVDRAFIQACQHLHYDAIHILYPYIADISVFTTALAKATSTGSDWLSELHIIERLLEAGVEGEVVESALVKGAKALNYGCLELLSSRISRWEAYTKALDGALTNNNWRQSLNVIEFLLDHGAHGEPVDNAYILAAGSLDYCATSLLAGHVDNANVDCQAFTVATSDDSWLSPSHSDLLKLLYARELTSDTVEPALVFAAKALNVPAVELLARNADQKMASAAFASATIEENDWSSGDGTTIVEILAQKGARGDAVDQALIDSAQQLRLDLVEALQNNVDKNNSHCFSAAFDAAVTSSETWLSSPVALNIFQILIEKGAAPESASEALVRASEDGNLEAVSIFTQVVNDPSVYSQTFSVLTQAGSLWLRDECYQLLELLLSHGVAGDVLHSSIFSAIEGIILGDASTELLILLLNYGADVNFGDGEGLQLASQYGRIDLLGLLTQCGPDSTTLYMGLKKALCSDHSEQTVLELFQSIAGSSEEIKPDVNHDSALGLPLIFYCLQNYPSSIELARKLCDLGADMASTVTWTVYEGEPEFPAPTDDRITPLLFALLSRASDEVIENVLLAHGADHEYVARQSQANALVLAAKIDRHHILSTLLDLVARIQQKDCFDRTALFYAGRNGNVAALTSLLKKKPPLNDGSLHEAARMLHPNALKTLVAAGHDINFPSLKHGGRTPLCELCYKCRGSEDPVGLHDTLTEFMAAKAAPLKKCRGRAALFFAIENEDAVTVVGKLLEVCLWQDLNDPANVFEQDGYSYSATMYIKKGISLQTEKTALDVLEVLQDSSAEDRYYAKERMQQPKDAVGMPQRIADLDHKKWIRSTRLEEEQEDHQRRLRREMEEMTQRDQLNSSRHLLTLEQREDLARQTIDHNADAHWQSMQFRSITQDQAMRYKDQEIDHRLGDIASMHRLKNNLDQQVRGAQLQHDSQASQQKLGFLGQEQELKFDGAQAQQQLRLGGISAENNLKSEQETKDLQFRAARGTLDKADMDNKLKHFNDINADKVFTTDRLEDIARDSQQKKLDLDQRSRQQQLEYQGASEDRKLRTEGAMNQYRRETNDDTLRMRNTLTNIEQDAMRNKHQMLEDDRHNQLRFAATADRQKLHTLQSQGQIQNTTLHEKGRIENHNLSDKGRIENSNLQNKNHLMQENRSNELQHTSDMGRQRTANEYNFGQQRVQNEYGMGQAKVLNERNIGAQRRQNEIDMGQVRVSNERSLGFQRIANEQGISNVKIGTARQLNGLNRQKLIDGFQAQRAGQRFKMQGQEMRRLQ